jgi:hypothetical protein
MEFANTGPGADTTHPRRLGGRPCSPRPRPGSQIHESLLDPQYLQQRASEKCYPQHCNWTFGIITVFPLVFQYPAQT